MKSYLLVTMLVLSTFLLTSCNPKAERQNTEEEIRVRTTKPVRRNFQDKIAIQGVIQSRQTATVSSLMPGTLDVIRADEGTVFKKGDFMFQVDKHNLENNVVVARQDLKVAEANLVSAKLDRRIAETVRQKAELDYKRAKRLKQSEAISTDAYEQAQVNLKTKVSELEKADAAVSYSQTRVEQERIKLMIAKKNLADSMPPAPFDGVITRKYVDQGEYMQSGSAIVDIENINSLEISAIISMLHYPYVTPGKTKLRFTGSDRKLGEITIGYRAPSIKADSRTFEIKGNLPDGNPGKALCGTLFDGELILQEREGTGVPTDAILFRKDGRFVVFTAENGKAVEHEVVPGIADGKLTEITNPEAIAGKEIITEGQSFLNPGDRIVVVSGKQE